MISFKSFMNEDYYRIDHGKAPKTFSGNQSHGRDDSGKEIKGVYATHKKHAIGHAYAVPREVPWVFHHHHDGQKHLYIHKDHENKVENHTATLSKFHKSGGFRGVDGGDEENVSKKNEKPHTQTKINSADHIKKQGIKIHYVSGQELKQKGSQTNTDKGKTFKAAGNENINEEMTFKVEVEGLPDMFMKGNSPGSVKAHLRKLMKQPSMIKNVDRITKHNLKKTYRKRAQGNEEA